MASYNDGLIHNGAPSDLEVVPQPSYLRYKDESQQQYAIDDQPTAGYAQSPKTILGMRRMTFFLLVIIIILILAGAIGGGVGGSLAVQNARNSAQNAASVPATPTTVSVIVTATSSAIPSQSALLIKLTCPDSNNTVYPAANGGRFVVNCAVNYPYEDIQRLENVTTLNDCIEHCAYFNKPNPLVPCVAVALRPSSNTCWIKSRVGPGGPGDDIWFAQTCSNC